MRRIVLILIGLVSLAALAATTAAGEGEDGGGDYLIRAYFDNAGFLVQGEDVRIAGASVGSVEEVDVSRVGEPVKANGDEDPGKAVVVMSISDPGFQDFRADASCFIRPQSLLGEKFVECDPTQPHAPGSELEPSLEQIPEDSEWGPGEYMLPIENNGKAVDLDLVNNITRESEIERFRLILNDLGAGLAARGDDLAEVLRRANPALQQTDRVLAVLAEQNQGLAQLAEDSDAILAPLARERSNLAGFIRNAAIAGSAAAERSSDISLGFERFPPALAELESTMIELRKFAIQGEPVATNLRAAAPGLAAATRALGPFSEAGTIAFTSLGEAADASGENLAASDPVVKQLKVVGEAGLGPAKNLKRLLGTFRKTRGIVFLMKFILNTSNTINGFDELGHFLRAQLLITNCVNYEIAPSPGCDARWADSSIPVEENAIAPPITQELLDFLRTPLPGAEPPAFEAKSNDGSDFGATESGEAGADEAAAPDQAGVADGATEDGAAAAQGAADLLEFLTGDGQ